MKKTNKYNGMIYGMCIGVGVRNCIRCGIQSYYIRISYRTGSENVCWESFY